MVDNISDKRLGVITTPLGAVLELLNIDFYRPLAKPVAFHEHGQ
jgi:hypothetical protein